MKSPEHRCNNEKSEARIEHLGVEIGLRPGSIQCPRVPVLCEQCGRSAPIWKSYLRANSQCLNSGTENVPQRTFCDKDFAELSGELSGAICLKTLVLLGSALELSRNVFGAVRAICLALGFFLGS